MKKQVYFLSFMLVICAVIFAHCSLRSTTYAALKKETNYMGNTTCQSCHKRIFESYQETGMGKSYYRPSKENIIEKFDNQSVVYDSALNFSYFPFWENDSMYVMEFRLQGKDTLYKRTEKIDFIVGSGHQTRSYILVRNDYHYEVPITWYVSKGIWDLSPGYEKGGNARFSREIGEECMACHTGNFEFLAGSKNQFRKVDMGIDCERCHGPAEAHIARMAAGDEVDVSKEIDYSIVNPKKLPIQAQFDVCQQCHLQGTNVLKNAKSVRDFRPSMALNTVYEVFIPESKDPNSFGIASHADRLQQSKCFLQSNGKLVCTTCHDPHKSIAKTDSAVYIKQCQACHTQKTCKASPAVQATKGGNCITCHLPKGGTSDIPHVNFHDHKIRVVQENETQKKPEEVKNAKEFVALLAVNRTENNDDIVGKAHLQYFETIFKHENYLNVASQKLSPNSLYEKARLLFYQKQYDAANQQVQNLLRKEDENVLALFLAGEIAEAKGEYETAFNYYQKAYKLNQLSIEAGLKAVVMLLKYKQGDMNVLPNAQNRLEALLRQKPFDEKIWANYGFVLMNQRKFPEAEKALSTAINQNPDYIQALENMVLLQRAKGNEVKAIYFEQKLAALKAKKK